MIEDFHSFSMEHRIHRNIFLNSKFGRLNSCSICILIIFHLQKVGVLPNLQEVFPKLNGDIDVDNEDYQQENILEDLKEAGWVVGNNKSSLGALFCGFLEYYSTFDFNSKWISIKRGMALNKVDEKGNKHEGLPDDDRFIIVEDPFIMTPFNCGRTVYQKNMLERIQLEFQLAVKRIKATHQISEEKSLLRVQIDKEGIDNDLRIKEIEDEKEFDGVISGGMVFGFGICGPRRFYDPVIEVERTPWPEVLPRITRMFDDIADYGF